MTNNKTKCKNCGGNVVFNPKTKCLFCENCDSSFDINLKKSHNVLHNFFNEYEPKRFAEPTNVYVCNSCGSVHIANKDENVARCATCGSVDFNQTTSVSLVPDNFVPFSVTKDEASSKFRTWLEKRKFAPNKLKKYAREGKLTGVYVPCWRFVYDYQVTYSGYIETRTRDRDGNVHISRRPVSGTFVETNNLTNISASKNIYNIDELESFSEGDNGVEYDEAYTFGFSMLEKDLNEDDAYKRLRSIVNARADREVERKEFGIVDYTFNVKMLKVGVQFNYVPLWVNYYTYQNKTYRSLINGSTGKVVGKYPKSFWKIFGLCAGIIAFIALLVILLK